MAVSLNHTIVWCRDQQKSAGFLTEILDRPAAVRFGPFLVVELDNGASLDFYQRDGKIRWEEHTSELQPLMRISYAVISVTQKRQHQRDMHHKESANSWEKRIQSYKRTQRT